MVSKIKQLLFFREIDQKSIARKAGVSSSFISRVIAGKDKASPRVRKALSEALGMSEKDLFEEEMQNEKVS